MSAFGGNADITVGPAECPLMTLNGYFGDSYHRRSAPRCVTGKRLFYQLQIFQEFYGGVLKRRGQIEHLVSHSGSTRFRISRGNSKLE